MKDHHRPVIITPPAACTSWTAKGTLHVLVRYEGTNKQVMGHSQGCMIASTKNVDLQTFCDENLCSQRSPMLRLVSMVMAHNKSPPTCPIHHFENVFCKTLCIFNSSPPSLTFSFAHLRCLHDDEVYKRYEHHKKS